MRLAANDPGKILLSLIPKYPLEIILRLVIPSK